MTTRDPIFTPPAGGPLWPGPRLAVPMLVEALVLGSGNVSNYGSLAPNYAALLRNQTVAKPPFSAANLPQGVNLHWTLPWALRNGNQPPGGEMTFPMVPNRWLITRMYYPKTAAPGTAPQTDLYIVESDYQGKTADDGTYPFPSSGDPHKIIYLGRKQDASKWSETARDQAQWLTAVAPGFPTFTAVREASVNVFTFVDFPGPEEGEGSLSYSVVGWNANPPSDVLLGWTSDLSKGWSTQDEWSDLMKALQWSVPDLTVAQTAWTDWLTAHPSVADAPGKSALNPEQLKLPSQAIFHGQLCDIKWKGTKGQHYPVNVPTKTLTDVPVAVGLTGPEALAAWVAGQLFPGKDDGPTRAALETVFLAIDAGAVKEMGTDPRQLQDRLHRERFKLDPAWREWVVQRPQDDSAQQQPTGVDSSLPLTPEQTEKLTTLNAAQYDLDAAQDDLADLQWRTNGLFWKQKNVPAFIPDRQKIIDAIDVAIKADAAASTALKGKIQSVLQVNVAKAKDALTAALGKDYVLARENRVRASHGNAPVLLIAGANRSIRQERPPVTTAYPGLPARFTGQTITGIGIEATVGGTKRQETVTGADILAALTRTEPGDLLPKEVDDLLAETFLLDPAASFLIAQLFFKAVGHTPTEQELGDLAATIAKQQTAPFNAQVHEDLSADFLAAVVKLIGKLPDLKAVTMWEQPWEPLFIDWRANWRPTASTPQDALTGWTLGEVDYEWDPQAPVTGTEVLLAGRAQLAGDTTTVFVNKLTEFCSPKNPEFEKLLEYQQQAVKDAIGLFENADIVLQSLDTYRDASAMRMPSIQTFPTEADISDAVGPSYGQIPDPGSDSNPAPYFPLRAGHLELTQLQVVDFYGQALAASQHDMVVPHLAQSVQTPGEANVRKVQIAPRITPGVRPGFELVSAATPPGGPVIPTNSSDATAPIAGWLLADHLDHALTVFDPSGTLKGQLMRIDSGGGTGLRWEPVPGLLAPYGVPPDTGNRHMDSFANTMLALGRAQTPALAELLAVIDTVSWTMSGLGHDQGQLSVIAGRPLALVTAQISIQMPTGPSFNQGWTETGKNDDEGYPNVPLNIRVGDIQYPGNGVIGYFLNKNFGTFYPASGASTVSLPLSQALRADPGGRKGLAAKAALSAAAPGSSEFLKFDNLIELPPDRSTVLPITLVVDPRGVMPVVTGLMPSATWHLAPGPVDAAFQKMEITFRIGPVLTSPERVRMPLPAQIKGDWSWVQRNGVSVWQEDDDIKGKSDVMAPQPLVLREGWLKLAHAFGNSDEGGGGS